MANIIILGAGAMSTAFAYPCSDNNHEVSIVGTHLENKAIEELKKAAESIDRMHSSSGPSQMAGQNENNRSRDRRDPLGRVPPGQGSSHGGDVGLPNEPDITRARKIAKQLYLKAEESLEGTVERRYEDSLLDWY